MKIALLIIGVLLLLPGLCGGFVFIAAMPDTLKYVITRRTMDYHEAVVMISSFSLMVGCLAPLAISFSGKVSALWEKRFLVIGLIVSLVTIFFSTAYFFRLMNPDEVFEWYVLAQILIIAVAIVPLPLYWRWRKI